MEQKAQRLDTLLNAADKSTPALESKSSEDLLWEVDREYRETASKLVETQLELDHARYQLATARVSEGQGNGTAIISGSSGAIKNSLRDCKYALKSLLDANKRLGKAVLKRVLWEASKRVRVRFHPLLVTRGVERHGRVDAGVLLAPVEAPRMSHTLIGPRRIFRCSIKSRVDNLCELGLWIRAGDSSKASGVTISIVKGRAVIRQVCVEAPAIAKHGPTVVRFEPIEKSLGQRFTLRVVAPESSADNPLYIDLFGTFRFLPAPWLSQSEAVFSSPDLLGESFLLPCFKASASSTDVTEQVIYSGDPATIEYAPLYGDRVATISFQAPATHALTHIYVTFGTHRRINHTPIVLRVHGGDVSWEGEFNAAHIIDTAPHALPIPASVLQRLKGSRVTVTISAPHALSNSQVAILGSRSTLPSQGAELPLDSMIQRLEKRVTPYSEFVGTPVYRRAFLEYPSTRPLSVQILLSEAFAPWWMRGFAAKLRDSFRALGHESEIHFSPRLHHARSSMRQADILLVCMQEYSNELRDIVTDVRATYGIVAALEPQQLSQLLVGLAGPEPAPLVEKHDMLAACSAVMAVGEEQHERLTQRYTLPVLPIAPSCEVSQVAAWLDQAVTSHTAKHLPKVSIVTVLYRKEREIPFFLQALAAQNYPGDLELVVVDDCSPDESRALLRSAYDSLKAEGKRLPEIKLIVNPKNLGNCGSRNRALQDVSGEIVVIVDADCLLNQSFISAHVYSHIFHQAGAVIGPCNLESADKDPMTALEDFDRERPRVMAEALLQDPVNVDSFVNCITRNFSIQRHLITEELFDEQFGYSAHPDSGFGWEDVEMGYRLHKRGIKIHFAEDAFSVHISHTSTTDDGVKPLKSLKNFRRLIKKHPSIENEARRWYIDTFQKIEKWSAGNKHPIVADQQEIRESLGQMYPYPFSISKRRKLRVLSYRWHVPHQYELYKLPHDFTLLSDLGTGFTRAWEFEQRPQPYNATFRSVHDLRVSDYDLAIIHFDENVLSHENCNGVIGPDWGANFRFFVEQLQGIPKVAICHGTPQFIGQYRPDYHESDLGTEIESSRRLLVDYLGDIPVVCNSYQAERSWGFRKSRVIWHGFDPSEFRATDYSGGILSLGKSMRERPHYRGYNHFKYVSEQLPEEYRPTFHSVPRPSLFMINQPIYARLKFDVYKESLRRHAVYFNPTLRSPMPRTRGEAMMSGLVTVSAANHDVQLFIKNGWNGFYSNSSEEMADYLLFLMRNKKSCREVGERSRATAVDIFNHDRYLHSWQSLIDEIVRG